VRDLKGANDMGKAGFRVACAVGVIGFLPPAFATEQVYRPVSPTFGGNPNNGPFLLSTAQSQGEGAKSGNQGPTINFPDFSTPTTSGNAGGNGAGAGAAATSNFVANPLARRNPMP
jgi:curli production assembly/transport component CsgF